HTWSTASSRWLRCLPAHLLPEPRPSTSSAALNAAWLEAGSTGFSQNGFPIVHLAPGACRVEESGCLVYPLRVVEPRKATDAPVHQPADGLARLEPATLVLEDFPAQVETVRRYPLRGRRR